MEQQAIKENPNMFQDIPLFKDFNAFIDTLIQNNTITYEDYRNLFIEALNSVKQDDVDETFSEDRKKLLNRCFKYIIDKYNGK